MKWYNIKFPISDDTYHNKYLELTNISKDAIRSDLLLLLLTQKGERYYNPNYGTDLIKFLFEPNDSYTINDIEMDIKNTVSLFLPNIRIDKIDFINNNDFIGDENSHQLIIKIKFSYTESAFFEQDELELKF